MSSLICFNSQSLGLITCKLFSFLPYPLSFSLLFSLLSQSLLFFVTYPLLFSFLLQSESLLFLQSQSLSLLFLFLPNAVSFSFGGESLLLKLFLMRNPVTLCLLLLLGLNARFLSKARFLFKSQSLRFFTLGLQLSSMLFLLVNSLLLSSMMFSLDPNSLGFVMFLLDSLGLLFFMADSFSLSLFVLDPLQLS